MDESPDKIYDLLKEKTGVDFRNNDDYEELLNKNIDDNKKIYSNNIKNLKECYDEYGYDENGYKKVDTESAGKIDFHNSQNNYIDKEAEHEITEAPSTKNKLKNINKNDIKKELDKGEKAIKNFDKNYNKALNEIAQMYYDAYKDNVKNPMSFEKFKKSIGIDTNKNNNKTVDIGYRSYDNNLVYTTFIKANIPDGPTAWLIFDQNGDVVSSASFDPKYRKVFVEKY